MRGEPKEFLVGRCTQTAEVEQRVVLGTPQILDRLLGSIDELSGMFTYFLRSLATTSGSASYDHIPSPSGQAGWRNTLRFLWTSCV